MSTISLSITNVSTTIFIEPIVKTFEGKDLKQAVGLALMECHRVLNKQYDAPCVQIGNVTLTDTLVKKIRKSYLDFQIEFGVVRESVLADLALTSKEAGVEYIRSTDRNGVFAKVKSFTTEQIAAQAKEQLRLTRDLTRWVKEDAKASVVPAAVAARRLQAAEAAKAKRIAAKAAAELKA